MAWVDDPNSTPHEIAAVLACDPALVSALMRVAKLPAQLSLSAGLGCPEDHPSVGDSQQTLAIALGFKPKTFKDDQDALVRQTRALYASEASNFQQLITKYSYVSTAKN